MVNSRDRSSLLVAFHFTRSEVNLIFKTAGINTFSYSRDYCGLDKTSVEGSGMIEFGDIDGESPWTNPYRDDYHWRVIV